MKVAIISTMAIPSKPYRLFSGYGGLEKLTGTWAEELAKRGHQVTLIGAQGSYAEGATVVELPIGLGEEQAYMGFKQDDKEFKGYKDLLYQHDVIFDNSWQHFPAMAWADGPRPPGQLVIAHHGVLGDISAPPPLEKPTWLCFSAAQSSYISLTLGIRTKYIHHGVDTSVFSPGGKREEYYLILSRLSAEKGVLPALQVLKKANKRVVIIADDQMIADRSYAKRVLAECDGYMVRFISGTTLPLEAQVNWMRCASALIHTPLAPWLEIGGLGVMESGACGVPVICSNNGVLPEILVHGETGWLVDTPEGLIEYLDKVREIEPAACRRRVEGRFDLATNASALQRVLEEAVATGGW